MFFKDEEDGGKTWGEGDKHIVGVALKQQRNIVLWFVFVRFHVLEMRRVRFSDRGRYDVGVFESTDLERTSRVE